MKFLQIFFSITISTISFIYIQAKRYSTDKDAFQVLYGISQNPDTGDFIFVQSYTINLTNWISGNEKIDDFIQEMQLKFNDQDDMIVFEWIPYNQFNEIKETGKNDIITVYSAIWNVGPLCCINYFSKHIRQPNKRVALKCIHNSQNITNEFLNEV